jgi:hypothetical protein
VSIESNSLELIQHNDTIEVYNPCATILAKCFLKAVQMIVVSFHHCPRNDNQVVHELAKFSYSSKKTHEWDGDPRDFILSDVIRDITLLSVK